MESRAAQPPPPRFYKLYAEGSDKGPSPPAPVLEGSFQQFGTLYEVRQSKNENALLLLFFSLNSLPAIILRCSISF